MTYAQRKSPITQAMTILKADIAAGKHARRRRAKQEPTSDFWNDKGDPLDGIRHGALDVFAGLAAGGYSKAEMNRRAAKHQAGR